MLKRLQERLFQPIDAASLILFRIAFGLLLFFEAVRYYRNGWVEKYWIEPDFYFRYCGFEWLPVLPDSQLIGLWGILTIATLMIASGFLYRIGAATFTLIYAYFFLLEQSPYLNHAYFIILIGVLMTVAPAHVDGSIDAKLRPKLRSRTVGAWSIWLLRFQMGVVYFFGGVAKLNSDWLHGQPLTMWLQTRNLGAIFESPGFGLMMSWGGAAFDLLIVPALLWKRTRAAAFALVLLFHLTNAWIFSIGAFPWLSIAVTALFFPPGAALFRKLAEPFRVRGQAEARESKPNAIITAFIIVWVSVQLIVPLRHLAYPGNVAWTEEGHRFAWRMKLRDRSTTGRLHVIDETTGEELHIRRADHLTEYQIDKFDKHADMILQYAHLLGREYDRPDRPVVVHSSHWLSLNGRKIRPFIDPEVDLSRVERSLGHADWIISFEETPLPGEEE